MACRILALLVLSYFAGDLADPTVPGVFSFATDRLFVDGVVQVKSASQIPHGAPAVPGPVPRLSPVVRTADVNVASRAAASPGVPSYQHRYRSHPPDPSADRHPADDDSVA